LVFTHATSTASGLLFYGYASLDSFNAGDQPLPGAVKEYRLPAGTISAYPDLEAGINMAAWAVAAQTQDVIDEEATAKAKESDESAEPVMRSFFADAVDVK
jgi:hypothetical protein